MHLIYGCMNGVVGNISHCSAVEIQDTLKKLKETESRCITSSTKLTVLSEYFNERETDLFSYVRVLSFYISF